MSTSPGTTLGAPTRIVVLGGGFAGVILTRRLEKLIGSRRDVEIVLVSRDNFFLITPLLFEACSGTLELRHCSQPIRPFLKRTRFIEASVNRIDLDGRTVSLTVAEGSVRDVSYDHLVLALGAKTNERLIPGSSQAFTFKTMADAIVLRNHLIERFERADVETDPEAKRRLLTVVIIGAGLVGTELMGELTAFVDEIVRWYRTIRRDEVRFHLIEAGPRILGEVDETLAAHAATVLGKRGVDIRTHTPVKSVDGGRVTTADSVIESSTIVLSAGITPSPVVAALSIEKDRHGRIVVDATMRSAARPSVWGLGDCAAVPDPSGKPYPSLAQHAVREAKVAADNIARALRGEQPRPFVYSQLGVMAALGHFQAIGRVLGIPLTGFPAWWTWRTYYLFQMPRWSRRIRIMIDWTVALFFRPDIVKVDLAVELRQLERGCAAGSDMPVTVVSGEATRPRLTGQRESEPEPLAASPGARRA
ncbi:MAG: NAD(P)/FAD-dependent oxidoreductase [Gemmatimonadaceae bacterium]